jgi:hypothetical protein
MHGGYIGRGVTINWNTTYKPSMIQVDNKPLSPIVPPSFIQPPTNQLPPTTPPQIINRQSNKFSDGAIAAITGLAAGTVAMGGYIGYKYINQQRPQWDRDQEMRADPRIREFYDASEAVRDNIILRDVDPPNFGRDVWSIITRYRFNQG